MWGGSRTNYEAPSINSYIEAFDHYNRVTPIKGRADQRLKPAGGKRTDRNRLMYLTERDEVVYQYQGREVSRWHPDNTCSVTTFPRQANGYFKDLVTPEGVTMQIGTRTGPILYLMKPGDQFWMEDTSKTTQWGGHPYVRNKDIEVVRAKEAVRLHYCAERGRWCVSDPDALQPFKWRELNQKVSRKAAAAAGLTDFDAWIKAVTALTDNDLPAYDYNIDPGEAIRNGDFVSALKGLPRYRRYVWKPQSGGHYVTGLATSYLTELRTRLYQSEPGALVERQQNLLTPVEHTRVEGQLRRFG